MSDTLITVIAIFLAAILMFVFPLLAMSERTDDVAQLSVQTATSDFVNTTKTVGKITSENYASFVQVLGATGNSYDIEMEVKHLDENIGKKSTWTQGSVIGENVYYSTYTSQIEEALEGQSVYKLKEGDIFSVSVKNTNTTISQTLRNFFYTVSGNDTYQVFAQSSGIVTANGI